MQSIVLPTILADLEPETTNVYLSAADMRKIADLKDSLPDGSPDGSYPKLAEYHEVVGEVVCFGNGIHTEVKPEEDAASPSNETSITTAETARKGRQAPSES